VLPDGEVGELVFTTLTKEALPVVRYRTRDLTRLLPGTARAMRRIEKITGRSDDMLIVRGVNVFPTQIEELILRDPRLAPEYRIRITRSGALDEIAVLVALRDPGMDPSDCAKLLRHNIKTFVGVSANIEFVPAESIEPSQGKARRVTDLREK
jgi:phenylacetate-CoA ligase